MTHRRLGTAILIAAALGLSPARPAQQDAEPHSSNLITLNVVALNSHDAPVADLTADDFQVTDHGKKQKIRIFRVNEDVASKPEPPLAPHQFSNRRGVSLPHVTVILFDVLNTPMTEQGYMKNQLGKALQSIAAGNHLYMYLLTINGLFPVRGLPDGETDPGPGILGQDAQKIVDRALSHVMMMNPGMYPEDRVRSTFLSLEALGGRLASITGRKNIVWITRGVPIEIGPNRSVTGDILDYEPLIRQFSWSLQQANVAIYPVDDGMASMQSASRVSLPDIASGGATSPGGRGSPNGAFGDPNTPDISSRQGGMRSMDTLQQLANLTGGRANFSNNVGAALKQALEDAQFSYLIGYYPPDENWDGKFHKIQVTCTKRGVRIQTRQGYYATPPATLLEGQQQMAFDAASLSPFDATEIGLRVTVSPSDTVSRGAHFQIHSDLSDIVLHSADGKYSGQFASALVQYMADGRMSMATPTPFKLEMTPEQLEEAKKVGIGWVRDWRIDDNVTKIRIILFDYSSKSTGSISIPIAEADRRSS